MANSRRSFSKCFFILQQCEYFLIRTNCLTCLPRQLGSLPRNSSQHDRPFSQLPNFIICQKNQIWHVYVEQKITKTRVQVQTIRAELFKHCLIVHNLKTHSYSVSGYFQNPTISIQDPKIVKLYYFFFSFTKMMIHRCTNSHVFTWTSIR